MRSTLFLSAALLVLAPHPAPAQASADSAAIRETALNYIDGYYTANADRMARAVHPELVKRIIARDPRLSHEVIQGMGATQLIEGTRAGGGSQTPVDKRKMDVTILDISYGKAAAVKIIATGWVDYLQVAKIDGQWKIVNVLWERTPAP
jgi:hypothetical protein